MTDPVSATMGAVSLGAGLLGANKQKKAIDGETEQRFNQTNNIVFAGSTSDLMKMISAEKAKTIDSKE